MARLPIAEVELQQMRVRPRSPVPIFTSLSSFAFGPGGGMVSL